MLGLPYITSCTQEQDQLYKEFKGKYRAMTNEFFTSKLTERSRYIKAIKEYLRVLVFKEDWGECDDTIVTPQMKFLLLKLKGVIRNPSLTKDELLSIINKLPGTTPLQAPFASTFTQEKNHQLFL